MIDSYRLLLFKYLYEKLNLKEFENNIEKNNINYIINEKLMCGEEKICYHYAKYFYLLNDININELNQEELKYLSDLNKEANIDNKISKFLETTYKKVLFSNQDSLEKYYGPINETYHVKGNYIVLGLKFEEYGFVSRVIKKRKEIENINLIIDNIIKKIEDNKNYNVKVIKYNELFEKLKNN